MRSDKMIMGRKLIFFVLGMSATRHFLNKIMKEKERKIERQNADIEMLERWMTLRDKGIAIDRYLQDLNCRKVAIYGLAMLGNHLYEELKKTNIEIAGIDRADIYDNYQMPIYKPDDVGYGDIDLIIVTSYSYEKIYPSLRKLYKGKIMSLRQLISESERYLY